VANLTLTDDGLEWLVKRGFDNVGSNAVSGHMAIGSGGTTPSASDAALVSETARVAFTFAYVSPGICTVEATFGAGVGTGTVAEVGVFVGSSLGILVGRALVGPFTKAAGASYTAQVTISLLDNNA
jgi:hypothetical protein